MKIDVDDKMQGKIKKKRTTQKIPKEEHKNESNRKDQIKIRKKPHTKRNDDQAFVSICVQFYM